MHATMNMNKAVLVLAACAAAGSVAANPMRYDNVESLSRRGNAPGFDDTTGLDPELSAQPPSALAGVPPVGAVGLGAAPVVGLAGAHTGVPPVSAHTDSYNDRTSIRAAIHNKKEAFEDSAADTLARPFESIANHLKGGHSSVTPTPRVVRRGVTDTPGMPDPSLGVPGLDSAATGGTGFDGSASTAAVHEEHPNTSIWGAVKAKIATGLDKFVNKNSVNKDHQLTARDEEDMYARDEDELYVRDDEDLYARDEEDLYARYEEDIYARNEEEDIYARDEDNFLYARFNPAVDASAALPGEGALPADGLATTDASAALAAPGLDATVTTVAPAAATSVPHKASTHGNIRAAIGEKFRHLADKLQKHAQPKPVTTLRRRTNGDTLAIADPAAGGLDAAASGTGLGDATAKPNDSITKAALAKVATKFDNFLDHHSANRAHTQVVRRDRLQARNERLQARLAYGDYIEGRDEEEINARDEDMYELMERSVMLDELDA